jgi:uncharacterized protein YbjT (DUF2867 family)
MYVITGITGQVGGAVARTLLAARQPVRAVVRDLDKAHEWSALGCQVALATMNDAAALTAAFHDAKGIFILPPPEFDPAPGFPEMRAVIDALMTAIERAQVRKIVSLSTIGAQATQTNLLTQHTLLEQALSTLRIPLTLLRPAWFMENFRWDLGQARDEGVIASFLHPLDKPVPMVATADVGRVAAELLQQEWQGRRIVELEAAQRISPNEAAAAFAKVLGHPVKAQSVPRDSWAELFTAQGMKHPQPRIRMLDGFNEGWIEFEEPANALQGKITLETVLRELVAKAA